MPLNYGEDYRKRYQEAFQDLGQRPGVVLSAFAQGVEARKDRTSPTAFIPMPRPRGGQTVYEKLIEVL